MKRPSSTSHAELLKRAQGVLERNDRGRFTIPAAGLYAHQVLWDSCFIAIGRSHYDLPRAQEELRSLLRGQWTNGMIPNIIFTAGKQYKLDRRIWRSRISPQAPARPATSGITQPPMLAEAIVRVGDKLNKSQRLTWYREMYGPLLDYHEWHYRERDPHRTGLIVQVHPWETGLDTTPPWMTEVQLRARPWWIRLLDTTRLDRVGEVFRRDTKYVPTDQRSSNIEALELYHILRHLRSRRYDNSAILHRPILAMADLSYNSIFVRANERLREIAADLGETLPEGLPERMKLTAAALKTLWNEKTGQYYSWNARTEALTSEPSLATFLPFYAGVVPREHARRLIALLHDPATFGTPHPIPSAPLDSAWFRPKRYWQGPSWVNTNWLIADGLQRAGYEKEAKDLEAATLAMVAQGGFYEYFDPVTGSGAGVNNFSWTAALVVDLLSR